MLPTYPKKMPPMANSSVPPKRPRMDPAFQQQQRPPQPPQQHQQPQQQRPFRNDQQRFPYKPNETAIPLSEIKTDGMFRPVGGKSGPPQAMPPYGRPPQSQQQQSQSRPPRNDQQPRYSQAPPSYSRAPPPQQQQPQARSSRNDQQPQRFPYKPPNESAASSQVDPKPDGNTRDFRVIGGKIGPSQGLLSYVDSFQFPYLNDVSNYDKLLKIGQGTFGEVFKARCKTTGMLVALKKILMENEKEGFPITALREVKMLQQLRNPHITELIEICGSKHKTGRDRCTFYLVFTFCDHDLAGLLSSQKAALKLKDIKTLVKHLLNGLFHIHSSKILHRDMKAANVLITKEGVLKLADFGLARTIIRTNDKNPCYTNRVVTLWYRPPELLLGERRYGPAIDMWGAGCIMAELWTRSPILQGDTEQKQLTYISHLCGSINTQTWANVDKLPLYNQLELAQNLPRRVKERLLPYVKNDQALNMIDQLLTLNPEERPDADTMLDHQFFFEDPLPGDNIGETLKSLPNNMFEYTAGRGAHANRGRQQHQQVHRQQRAAPTASSSVLSGYFDRTY